MDETFSYKDLQALWTWQELLGLIALLETADPNRRILEVGPQDAVSDPVRAALQRLAFLRVERGSERTVCDGPVALSVSSTDDGRGRTVRARVVLSEGALSPERVRGLLLHVLSRSARPEAADVLRLVWGAWGGCRSFDADDLRAALGGHDRITTTRERVLEPAVAFLNGLGLGIDVDYEREGRGGKIVRVIMRVGEVSWLERLADGGDERVAGAPEVLDPAEEARALMAAVEAEGDWRRDILEPSERRRLYLLLYHMMARGGRPVAAVLERIAEVPGVDAHCRVAEAADILARCLRAGSLFGPRAVRLLGPFDALVLRMFSGTGRFDRGVEALSNLNVDFSVSFDDRLIRIVSYRLIGTAIETGLDFRTIATSMETVCAACRYVCERTVVTHDPGWALNRRYHMIARTILTVCRAFERPDREALDVLTGRDPAFATPPALPEDEARFLIVVRSFADLGGVFLRLAREVGHGGS